MIRYHDPDQMIEWAAGRIGGRYREDARAIGVERDGQLLAVGVFDTWFVRDCHFSLVTMPGTGWLRRDFFAALACFPFITGNLPRVTSHVPRSNPEAVAGALHLGMRLEGQLREAAPDGGDILVFGLLRRECRWLPKTYPVNLANPAE